MTERVLRRRKVRIMEDDTCMKVDKGVETKHHHSQVF
jgi:hypothetical protein